MSEFSLYNSIYNLINSELDHDSQLLKVIDILQEHFKYTKWNIAYLVESTGKLNYIKSTPEFENLSEVSTKVFQSGKAQKLKPDERNYKWLRVVPMITNNQKMGVLMCMGKTKIDEMIDNISELTAFLIQQSSLKEKLLKDTMFMNTLVAGTYDPDPKLETEQITANILLNLKKYLQADAVAIYLWDDEKILLSLENSEKKELPLPLPDSIVKSVKDSGRALMLQESHENPAFNPDIDAVTNNKEVLNLIAAPITVNSETIAVLIAVNNDPAKVFLGSELVWVKSACQEISGSYERTLLYRNLHKLFLSSVETLTAAIEGKDPYTHGHSRRVTMYALLIAAQMNFSTKDMETIRLASTLHDIGKIAVPESILLKPGKLNDEEWKIIREHPRKGVNILEPVQEFGYLLPAILHHHEHYDGAGYPSGLKSDEIPIEARIISVADAFDAMTSKRGYRNAMSEKEALIELERCSSSQFDPKVVEAFIDVYREKFFSDI